MFSCENVAVTQSFNLGVKPPCRCMRRPAQKRVSGARGYRAVSHAPNALQTGCERFRCELGVCVSNNQHHHHLHPRKLLGAHTEAPSATSSPLSCRGRPCYNIPEATHSLRKSGNNDAHCAQTIKLQLCFLALSQEVHKKRYFLDSSPPTPLPPHTHTHTPTTLRAFFCGAGHSPCQCTRFV